MPMTAESVAIYLGIILAGGVVVGIADSFAPDQIATRLRIAHAKTIFTQDIIRRGDRRLPLYERIVAAQAPSAIVITAEDIMAVTLRPGDIPWEDFLSDDTTFEAIARTPADHTNILFSSGTTGEPKAIPWNHATPIKGVSDAHLHHDIHPGEVVAWPTNLGWMMGPWLIYAGLVNRATLALYYGAPTDTGFGRFVQDAQVNMLGVIPSLVRAWCASDCMAGLDWSAIKAFSSTGESANPEDMLYLSALAGYKPVIEYCGGTEIAGGYVTGSLVQPTAPSCFTTPTLGLDFVLLDEAGNTTQEGEAFLLPPSIGFSSELLNRDHHQVYYAATPPYLNTILRRHGDRLERLPGGYYRVQGRMDDTMNLGGIKVGSSEIERLLVTLKEVRETAAIGVSPPDGGPSQLVVYAVLNSEPKSEPKDATPVLLVSMQNTLRQRLNPLFKISDLVITDTLPRTASNKIMRRVLRDQYRESQSSP
jgi:acetyl-CoA synthetase